MNESAHFNLMASGSGSWTIRRRTNLPTANSPTFQSPTALGSIEYILIAMEKNRYVGYKRSE